MLEHSSEKRVDSENRRGRVRSFRTGLLIDPASHDLLEILSYNAQRQPVRCARDGLF